MIRYIKIDELNFLKPKPFTNLTRLGSLLDGGYVLPLNSVLESSFLLSGGISVNSDFENDIKSINPNIKVVLVDGSLNIFKYFILRPFYKLFTKGTFYPFVETYRFFKIHRVSIFLKKYIGLNFGIDRMLQYAKMRDDSDSGILKLDIEGGEYEVLDMIIDNKLKFNTIIIEFHDVERNLNILKDFVKELSFNIVNVSINEVGITKTNFPNLLEITFVNDHIYDAQFIGQHRNNIHGNDILVLEFN